MDAVETQIYRKKGADGKMVEKADRFSGGVPEHRMELCKKLGLDLQAKHDATQADIETYYPCLSAREWAVWRLFLPAMYSKNADHWKGYKFDRVPNSVLDEIGFADSLQVFDDLLIGTRENRINSHIQAKDPAVFGMVGLAVYLICRWGESLQPFEEITKSVVDRMANGKGSLKVYPVPPLVAEAALDITAKEGVAPLILRWDNFGEGLLRKLLSPIHCGEVMYVLGTNWSRHYVCAKCSHVEKRG